MSSHPEPDRVIAMPRYFFSLVDGKHSISDTEGRELNNPHEAHLHALRIFEKLARFLPDQFSPTWQIQVTLENGEAVLTVVLPALATDEQLRNVISA